MVNDMTAKAQRKHAQIGMPVSASQSETGDRPQAEDERQFAPREQALAFAAALASRNAELMRRLA